MTEPDMMPKPEAEVGFWEKQEQLRKGVRLNALESALRTSGTNPCMACWRNRRSYCVQPSPVCAFCLPPTFGKFEPTGRIA